MISAQFETMFAAVNTSPNCLVWLNKRKFCAASLRSVVIYSIEPVASLKTFRAGAQLSLNEHGSLISCVNSFSFNHGFLIASGDKSGSVVIRHFDEAVGKILSTLSLKLHSMCVNCLTFVALNNETYIFSCGDSSIKLTHLTIQEGKLHFKTLGQIDLGRNVPFQIDSLVVDNESNVLLAVALDDCKLHLYLWEDAPKSSENVTLLPVFQSEPFDDWIRGISIQCHPTEKGSIFIATSSQDSFVQLYRLSSPDSCVGKENLSMEKTRILNSSGKVVWQIFTESLLCGHVDKVYSVQFVNSSIQNEIGLLSASLDRSLILWSYKLPQEDAEATCNVWEDVMRVGDMGGNDLGFFGAQVSPGGEFIVAYNYTGSLFGWCCGPLHESTSEYSSLNWKPIMMSSGHFHAPVSLDWVKINDQENCNSKMVLMTAGKDKVVRAFGQVTVDQIAFWQEIGRPQVHGYEMASLSLLDSVTLVSAGDEKVVRVFSCTTSFTELVQSFCGVASFQIPGDIEISSSAAVPALGLSNKAGNDDYLSSKGCGDRDIFSNAEVKGNTSCFTNSYLTEKTLWSEQNKLYGHGNEVFCVTTFASSSVKLIASSCKATSVDTAVILLWQYQSLGSNSCELVDSSGGRAHSLTVTDLQFSHDGTFLLAVSRDRSFSVFYVQPGSQYKLRLLFNKPNHHKRIIWKCCWLWNQSAAAKNYEVEEYKFLTASRDKTVALWNFGKSSTAIANPSDSNVEPELLHSHVMSSGLTAVDVVKTSYSESSDLTDSFHLVAVGLENGSISLLKIDKLGKFSLLHTLDSLSAHVLDVNCLKFSISEFQFAKRNDSETLLWLASCSNDCIVKMFKIVFGEI